MLKQWMDSFNAVPLQHCFAVKPKFENATILVYKDSVLVLFSCGRKEGIFDNGTEDGFPSTSRPLQNFH